MTDRHIIYILLIVIFAVIGYIAWTESDKPAQFTEEQEREFNEANHRAGRAMLLDDLELAQKEREEAQEKLK